jgi:hypothetical protein
MAEKHIYKLSIYCVTCFPLEADGFAAAIKPEKLRKAGRKWHFRTRPMHSHEWDKDECQQVYPEPVELIVYYP